MLNPSQTTNIPIIIVETLKLFSGKVIMRPGLIGAWFVNQEKKTAEGQLSKEGGGMCPASLALGRLFQIAATRLRRDPRRSSRVATNDKNVRRLFTQTVLFLSFMSDLVSQNPRTHCCCCCCRNPTHRILMRSPSTGPIAPNAVHLSNKTHQGKGRRM